MQLKRTIAVQADVEGIMAHYGYLARSDELSDRELAALKRIVSEDQRLFQVRPCPKS